MASNSKVASRYERLESCEEEDEEDSCRVSKPDIQAFYGRRHTILLSLTILCGLETLALAWLIADSRADFNYEPHFY